VNWYGQEGSTVEILGQGLKGSTAVSFNGTPADFQVVSNTYLTATVPAGATLGPIAVTTQSGKLVSKVTFRVLPHIISFTPTSGAVGTSVTITGTGFTQALGVGFGDHVPATNLTVVSDTEVTATVPSGAKTGRVGIKTKSGTGISTQTFSVTK
jgi:hypothetical protein